MEEVKATGPYLNFFIKKDVFSKEVIGEILKKRSAYGSSLVGKGKTAVIDMSSPNIAKPFGIGHLRSTVIGNSIAQLLSFSGYKVIKVNYLGDWGTQFGKLIVAYRRWGSEKELQKSPIKHLYDLYVRFHKEAEKDEAFEKEARGWFKKLEENDAEAMRLWSMFRECSLKDFEKIYKRLGVTFDVVSGESKYNKEVDRVLLLMKDKGVLEESEEALIVNLDTYSLPAALIQKSDGTKLYLTRDIAAALERKNKYKADLLLYEVGSEQKLHFEQLRAVLKALGFSWAESIIHIHHGLYSFAEGKISTRKGNVIFVEDILDKAVALVHALIKEKNPGLAKKEKVAEIVGTSAVIFHDLINDRAKDIVFDWKKMLDFEGETGPYVQYAYVRICSILKKAKIRPKSPDYGLLKENQEQELIKKISLFPSVVSDAARQYKPHIIAKYVVDVAQSFSRFYENCQCISNDRKLTEARIALVIVTKQVIGNSLWLLGIKILEEM